MDEETKRQRDGLLFICFCGAIIAALIYVWQIQPVDELGVGLLEDWVELEYPISEDIAEAYRDDNKISNSEFSYISRKVEKLQEEQEENELEKRVQHLAGER